MPKNAKRWLGGAAIALICCWLGFVGYINWAMRQSPEVFGHVMAGLPMPAFLLFPFETMWMDARKGTLNTSDPAPDLTVKKLEGHAPIQLASLWRQRPVVLVFGSYT